MVGPSGPTAHQAFPIYNVPMREVKPHAVSVVGAEPYIE
jgi:hypothetical protein